MREQRGGERERERERERVEDEEKVKYWVGGNWKIKMKGKRCLENTRYK